MLFPYSIEDIQRIFEEANTDGLLKKEWLCFNGVDGNNKSYIDIKKQYNTALKEFKVEKKKSSPDLTQLASLEQKYENAAKDLDDANQAIATRLFEDINDENFELSFDTVPLGKKTGYTAKDLCSFIASKIITQEVKRVYKSETPDRDLIIGELKAFLDDPVDKFILRADIRSFFESIPMAKLIQKLEEDGYVSPKSVLLLSKMSEELTDKYHNTGVPRGMSFASVLSETYMRDIDRKIKQLDGVYFYRRYVDDIILLASIDSASSTPEALYALMEKIINDKQLALHHEKGGKYMATVISYRQHAKLSFDYLGYHISRAKGASFSYGLKDSKVEDYKTYIDFFLTNYADYAFWQPKRKKEAKANHEKVATKVYRHSQPLYRLYKELNYLTRNYHLGGTKSHILSGVFFKHRYLTDMNQLKELDAYLAERTDFYISPKRIKSKKPLPNGFVDGIRDKIKSHYSFYEGYKDRRMCRMSSADLKRIKRLLKYAKVQGDENIAI